MSLVTTSASYSSTKSRYKAKGLQLNFLTSMKMRSGDGEARAQFVGFVVWCFFLNMDASNTLVWGAKICRYPHSALVQMD